MLKYAYEMGVRAALEEAGLTKEAFNWGKALDFGMKNPYLTSAGAGAALGGLSGFASGHEGGTWRGALTGAGAGFGMAGGARLAMGKQFLQPFKSARGFQQLAQAGKLPQRAADVATQTAQRYGDKMFVPGLIGGTAGMAAGGALAGGAAYHGRPQENPWGRGRMW